MKVLVLGASGGMGSAIVNELTSREMEVVAFARTKAKLYQLYGNNSLVNIVAGDMLNGMEVIKAAEGTDLIIHSVNVPYAEWAEKLPKIMQHTLNAAKKHKTRLAIVDNIYGYGKNSGKKIKEDQPKQAHTRKGQIRLELEQMVKDSGVSYVIAHFPDFYGPHAGNAILNYYLQSVAEKKRSMFVGDPNILREYIYTPDGAKALVNLAIHETAYGRNWNIPATDVISGKQIFEITDKLTNQNGKPVIVNKLMIQLLGLFDKNMREVVEMFYLTKEPVVLDGELYEREIGPIPKTSYEEGLKETLRSLAETREQEETVNGPV
ncbi:NAD(P)H-binding protein [Gracilibacillus oryzae]|uniref:NAD(P)H-binding protein n=1 Tax=Gracilibacillus oryzae TaxID=1672701 RepID=A0A7C8L151_9BACI|nr:NAD(P)H-binding protein [Gracilibacillus oryzae]KAB8139354.1 NAD(P)H-binding protein [Gracilibacillus oryzae]